MGSAQADQPGNGGHSRKVVKKAENRRLAKAAAREGVPGVIKEFTKTAKADVQRVKTKIAGVRHSLRRVPKRSTAAGKAQAPPKGRQLRPIPKLSGATAKPRPKPEPRQLRTFKRKK